MTEDTQFSPEHACACSNQCACSDSQWRPVFIVSDGTAITAETLAHSVMTQFPDLSYDKQRIPFIDTIEKAKQTAEKINAVQRRKGVRALVFSTFVDPICRVPSSRPATAFRSSSSARSWALWSASST